MMKMVMMKMMGILIFFSVGICGHVFGGEFPVGYPFSGWGEISERGGNGGENGFKLEGYLEQGIDWYRKGNWTFNTFVGLRGMVSDRSEYWWNNKVGPWAGIKVKRLMEIENRGWATINIGARWEGYRYFSGPAPREHENSAVLFLQWEFGGDWKRKRE